MRRELNTLVVPQNEAEIRAAAAIPDMIFSNRRRADIWRGLAGYDRVTQHALIYNLLERNIFSEAHSILTEAKEPGMRQAALLAAAQMPSSALTREDVLPLLVNDDFALRKTAFWVVTKHPEWAEGVSDALGEWLARPKFGEEDVIAVRGALVAFGADESLQTTIAESLSKRQSDSSCAAGVARSDRRNARATVADGVAARS